MCGNTSARIALPENVPGYHLSGKVQEPYGRAYRAQYAHGQDPYLGRSGYVHQL